MENYETMLNELMGLATNGKAPKSAYSKKCEGHQNGQKLRQRKYNKYPLTNISYDTKTELLFVEVALAGFSKDSISINVQNDKLVIAGSSSEEASVQTITYVQQDIAFRDFERIILLDSKYRDGKIDASFENGLLTITLEPGKVNDTTIEIR